MQRQWSKYTCVRFSDSSLQTSEEPWSRKSEILQSGEPFRIAIISVIFTRWSDWLT